MASSLPLIVLLLCSLGVAHSSLRVYNLRARGLPPGPNGNTNGFVKVYCGARYLGKTRFFLNSPNPDWTATFLYAGAQSNQVLRLRVYDKAGRFDIDLGSCSTPVKRGTFQMRCSLRKGGILFFSYSFR